jgi:hypothetical protein
MHATPHVADFTLFLYSFYSGQGVNSNKTLSSEHALLILNNLSTYMNCITLESSAPLWASIISQFDIFFRTLPGLLPNPCDMTAVLKIMIAMLKVSGISNARVGQGQDHDSHAQGLGHQ